MGKRPDSPQQLVSGVSREVDSSSPAGFDAAGFLRLTPHLLASIALVAITGGCEAARPKEDSLEHPRDSSAILVLRESSTTCLDCIKLDSLAVLGERDGPGFVVYAARALQDGLGRFWLLQWDHLKVFEVSGRFVGEVGRVGQGPLEFSIPIPVRVEAGGNVHIVDPGNQRVTVVSPDFKLVSESGLPSPNLYDFAPLREPDSYVVNMWLATPEGIGHPLHVIRGREVVRSFGAVVGSEPQDPLKAHRVLAVDSLGRIFSSKVLAYELDVWTPGGRRILGYSGPQLNKREPRGVRFNLDDNPIPNSVLDMQVQANSRLWVLFRMVKENWRQYFVSETAPNGATGIRMRPGITEDSVFMSRLDVIDLTSGAIVARRLGPERLTRFAGPGIVFGNGYGPDEIPVIRVFRAILNRPAR